MRSGVVALSAPNGESLVAWKHEDELGWQLYDQKAGRKALPALSRAQEKERPLSLIRMAVSFCFSKFLLDTTDEGSAASRELLMEREDIGWSGVPASR